MVRILSLGAGVQSSTLALMMAHGEIEPCYAAIFADTQDEPQEVYRWLDWLEAQLPFPVIRATAGNLMQDFLDGINCHERRSVISPPFFVRRDDTGACGMLRRECTNNYKIGVVRREIRKIMRELGAKSAVCVIGISYDEAHRMRESRVKYIINDYPLVDRRITRYNCLRWLREKGYPQAVKSSCIKCPYRSDAMWREMKLRSPDEFAKAVEFDRQLRQVEKGAPNTGWIGGAMYLHRSLKPLDEVDLSTLEDHGQMRLFGDFGNECEGMCGV